jgi:peptidylprolyl isomerase
MYSAFTRVLAATTFALIAAGLVSCQQSNLPDGMYARFSTPRGRITVRLEFEKAPLTVCNFVGLAEGSLDATKGTHFYDGLVFHRVEPGFVVQGGDPAGNGTGGPGYQFADEINPELKFDSEGVLGMANAGPNTNGSQFFITLKDTSFLTGHYSVFGKVVEGMDAVKKIVKGDKLDKVEIIRVGAAAKAFKSDQAAWNDRNAAILESVKKLASARQEADLALIAKQWPDLVKGSDGIFQKTLKPGSGATPQKGQSVSVNYKGSFLDGKVFDASSLHGGPFSFKIGAGQIIEGWDRVVSTMKKGEKRFVVLPPELAYGQTGTPGGPIPPNAFLAFEIEVVDIK